MRHFLKETDFSAEELPKIFALAHALKQSRADFLGTGSAARVNSESRQLKGQSWGMIFAKSSTRTRVSFEVGIHELGGHPIFLSKSDIQLGRGETVADTARVLSRYLHGLIVRTYAHAELEELAANATMPVINALTDFLHPCQIYTDLFTLAERYAPAAAGGSAVSGEALVESLRGRKLAYLGDCSFNMANSWILGGALFGMQIALAGPEGFGPGPEIDALLAEAGLPKNYVFTSDPYEAVRDADVVYTDVWASMGQEEEARERQRAMEPYAVTRALFAAARSDAYFMHCLPAHAGEEVEQAVLDDPRSIIFDEAENRLHTQKAIMATLVEMNRHTKR
ncbi:ornithine carbamoyltransferase [Cephaloticoccus capnophilus]|uniref:Ornithine carbamoyltransferase n=1 Tax=Cephaloticoccus capnophilus TaxID=1548208 RepID=A0A139SM59_9BACT|nr:ornithine carbamoyltransferase [Cephaloticoccus capnophilus]KXU35619.1 ornithine carbamoyltransferase [Cephaloticoccus capnophilus]